MLAITVSRPLSVPAARNSSSSLAMTFLSLSLGINIAPHGLGLFARPPVDGRSATRANPHEGRVPAHVEARAAPSHPPGQALRWCSYSCMKPLLTTC